VGLRDLDSCFGQLEGLLAPVDRHDRLKVSGDEGQKSRPHHADHHHDDDREPQHHSSLRAQQLYDYHRPPQFLRYSNGQKH